MDAFVWGSLGASCGATAIAWRLGFLTVPAAAGAALAGGIVLIFGGWDWGAATAGTFFVTAWLSQRCERLELRQADPAAMRRNLRQLTANAMLIAVLAVVYGTVARDYATVAAFLGCVGAVAGDTWATSVSQFSAQRPRLIRSGRRVAHGTPGAVSVMGTLLAAAAGVLGTALYVLVHLAAGGQAVTAAASAVLLAAAITGAVVGPLFDSLVGALWQARYIDENGQLTDVPVASSGARHQYIGGNRWLSNDLVNFGNSLAGAAAAYLVWQVAAVPAIG